MRILRGNLFKKRKSKFGNFELKPENGWKISQVFIDYESRLVVVDTSEENEKNWTDNGYGSRTIPTRQYIIDPKQAKILSFSEWSTYFSYEPKEIISQDGQFKLTVRRVHEPERNSDGIQEELLDLTSGKIVGSSDGVAFRAEKKENLLEGLYRKRKETEEKVARINAMPTLEQHFRNELSKLKEGDVILNYFNENELFELKFENGIFVLRKATGKWNYNLKSSSLQYTKYKEYNTILSFSEQFLSSKAWYLEYSPFRISSGKEPVNLLLKKFVIEFFNQLRSEHDFSYEEYYKLSNWENFFYQADDIKPSEYKQYCSNCRKEVGHYPRYPKYICDDCASLKITDENGIELSFSNIGFSGGLRITYKQGDTVIKEDTTQIEKLCFINGKRFIATEAKFGGVVIQTEK